MNDRFKMDRFLFPFAQQRRNRHGVTCLHPVFAPELNRIEAERMGNFIHVRFQGEECLRAAVSPVGAGHGQIGIDDVTIIFAVGAVVAAEAAQAGDGGHGEAVGAVGAGVGGDAH